jgi:hypothetical protein
MEVRFTLPNIMRRAQKAVWCCTPGFCMVHRQPMVTDKNHICIEGAPYVDTNFVEGAGVGGARGEYAEKYQSLPVTE